MSTYKYILILNELHQVSHYIGMESAYIYHLDGASMSTSAGMYDQFKDKLALPVYSGDNLDALFDSITTLQLDFSVKSKIYIVVENYEDMFIGAHENYRNGLLETLEAAGERWAEPIHSGEWWDRPSVDFKVVLLSRAATQDVP